MQICSVCRTTSPDDRIFCSKCNADLRKFSENAQALQRMLANDRIKLINIGVADDACPACREIAGTYPKDQVPILPVPGCSHENGCFCRYQPVLDVLYP